MMSQMPHQESTAEQIKKCIKAHPGLRAREIGSRLGLTRSEINSYLYTQRSPALGNEVYQDSNYGWHLKKTALEKEALPKKQESQPVRIQRSIERDVHSTPAFPAHASPQLDCHSSVKITLIEAFQGVHKTVHNGHENISIYIPPCTRPGTEIHIPKKGARHPSNHSYRGDLYCRIDLLSDDSMRLSGNNILSKAVITSSIARNGGQVEVQTLDGLVKVTIPQGVTSQRKLRLQQKGWPDQWNVRGDQLISLEIIESPTVIETNQELDKSYSLDVVEEVFRDPNYLELSDDEQSKLAELLEKARERQELRSSLSKSEKSHPLAVVSSPQFWIAVTIGGLALYGGVNLFSELFLPIPVEQPTNDTQ